MKRDIVDSLFASGNTAGTIKQTFVILIALLFLAPVTSLAGEIITETNLVYSQDELVIVLDQILAKYFPDSAPFWELPRPHPFTEEDEVSLEVIIPQALTGGRNWFQLRKDDMSSKSYLLPVDLFWEDSVWVTTRPVQRGETITTTDLSWRICRHSFLPGEISFDISPVGLCARKLIANGSIITASNLEPPPVIKRGTIVRLLYKSPGLTVSARAEALENGSQGEEIRVRTLDTRTPCRAMVMNATEVEVVIP